MPFVFVILVEANEFMDLTFEQFSSTHLGAPQVNKATCNGQNLIRLGRLGFLLTNTCNAVRTSTCRTARLLISPVGGVS